jgi:beta-lactamase regulating signal transducer with metallopeptidase domain
MNVLLDILLPGSSLWFQFIVDMSLKAIVLLSIAFIILLIGRRASFATRHFVLNLTIVSLLFIPLLSFILPAWEISLLPSIQSYENVSLSGIQIEKQRNQSSVQNNVSSTHPTFASIPPKRNIHWPTLLLVVWTIGAMVVLSRILTGIIGTKLIAKKAEEVNDSILRKLISDYAQIMEIKRRIRLFKSHKVSVPLTCGWLRPAVILPVEADSWSNRRKEIVLLHELAHIKRGDFLSMMITRCASIIYWFNPLVWIALRQLSIEREHASDEYVLAAGTKASEYAHHLLEIAKRLSSIKKIKTWLSPVGITLAKKSNLEVRIMSILSNQKPSTRIKPLTLILVCLFTLSIVIPVASIHTWAQSEKKQEQKEESTELPDLEEIKTTLQKFYECIEAMDFSRVLKFFTDISNEDVCETVPLVIVKKGKDEGDKDIMILSVKDWVGLSVRSQIKSIITKQLKSYIVTDDLVIKQQPKDEKRRIIVNNPNHTLIFTKEDGEWKIKCDKLHISFDKIKESGSKSKRIGLALTQDGVQCITIQVTPRIALSIKPKKKVEIKKEK